MSRPGLRVYFVRHADGGRVGFLMRRRELMFDKQPPAAYARSNQAVLEQLEAQLIGRLTEGDTLDRYLWEEEFAVSRIRVDVHPTGFVDKQAVIGKRSIPIELCYTWCKMEGGSFRVGLPRYRWWLLVEELGLAPDAIRRAVSTALLGENASWAYDFRAAKEEYVLPWEPASLTRREAKHEGDDEAEGENPIARAVAIEWVEAAAKHRLSQPLGSHPLDPTLQRLVGLGKLPSLLVTGGPGVGKTTLVKRLAFAALARRRLKQTAPRLWETSVDRILAGMMYVGMWQERVYDLMTELGGEHNWLYLGSLPALLDRQSSGSSIGDIVTPRVMSGDLPVIVEATPEELSACRRLAPALVARLEVLRIEPPPAFELVPLVEAALQRAGSPASPAAVRRLIEHLDSYRRDQCFPGKAFGFVDWANKQTTAGAETLNADRMSALFSSYSGLPLKLISTAYSATTAEIAQSLAASVVGQPAACEAAARVVARLKAKLNDPERPLGSLLLVGPTGVGKTELSKSLAALLFGDEERLIRFDMSEFGFPGAAARLLEVGREVRSLAEQVRRQPLCVVLLDEIEKAHPETFDLLLAVLGEGRLTDSLGRLVDFRSAVILMTSNLGAGGARSVGFVEASGGAVARAKLGEAERAARDFFRPEFFNRIDQVVSFNPLSAEHLRSIVDLELQKVGKRAGLVTRSIRLRATPEVRELLAELGYHPTYGARPLRRVIEERVVTPLAERLSAEPELREKLATFSLVGSELELTLS